MSVPRLDDGQLMFAFAHDLRSHLRTVLTRIQLVQANGAALLPESNRMFLDEAAAAAFNIDGLLSAMVTFCNVTAKGDSMGLRTLLSGFLLESRNALKTVDGEVQVVNDIDLGVPRAIQTVLRELLANAVRFRRPDERLGSQADVDRRS